MTQEILKQAQDRMGAAIDHFIKELRNIRTGQANPELLDGLTVEAYGSQMRLKELATVTVPEPRQLLIAPFDAANAGPIRQAIEKANMGFTPFEEGKMVRIQIPEMSADRRKEMVSLLGRWKEECKVSIRNVRREYNEMGRKMKADGELPEDMEKKLEKEIQELTDKFCKEAEEISAKKEQEISSI